MSRKSGFRQELMYVLEIDGNSIELDGYSIKRPAQIRFQINQMMHAGIDLVISIHERVQTEHLDGWNKLEEKTWTVGGFGYKDKLPPGVDEEWLADVLSLLNEAKGETGGRMCYVLLQRLEIEPALESGDSWLKKIIPSWTEYEMNKLLKRREWLVREALDT